MPKYEIRCSKNHYSEIFKTFAAQKAGDAIEQPCPECSGPTHVVISDSAVVWNTGGSTRGFGPCANAPALDRNRNLGHNPPTVKELNLSDSDCKELGI